MCDELVQAKDDDNIVEKLIIYAKCKFGSKPQIKEDWSDFVVYMLLSCMFVVY